MHRTYSDIIYNMNSIILYNSLKPQQSNMGVSLNIYLKK